MTDPDSCCPSANTKRIVPGTACDRMDLVTGGAFLHFFLFSPGDAVGNERMIAGILGQ